MNYQYNYASLLMDMTAGVFAIALAVYVLVRTFTAKKNRLILAHIIVVLLVYAYLQTRWIVTGQQTGLTSDLLVMMWSSVEIMMMIDIYVLLKLTD